MTYRNIYVYSPLKLWLAYGLALVFATGAVAAGLLITHRNQASYSNNFSTVLRVSRNAKLNTEFSGRDYSGADPLPSHLATATIEFHGEKSENSASMELLAVDEQADGHRGAESITSPRRASDWSSTASSSR
jgi:hypothetical protein